MGFDCTVCQCGASLLNEYINHGDECPKYDKVAHAYHMGKRDGILLEREACRTIAANKAKDAHARFLLVQAPADANEVEFCVASAIEFAIIKRGNKGRT